MTPPLPIKTVLDAEIRDLFGGEMQLAGIIPALAEAATDENLQVRLREWIPELKNHLETLRRVAEMLDLSLRETSSRNLASFFGEITAKAKKDASGLAKDVSLICAMQKLIHYKIAGYRNSVTLAHALAFPSASALLQTILDEEETTDHEFDRLMDHLSPHPSKTTATGVAL